MALISDINAAEKWLTEQSLNACFGETVDYQLVNANIRLQSSDGELSRPPGINGRQDSCYFTIFETADKKYRAQFL
jgi:hypothetical protein